MTWDEGMRARSSERGLAVLGSWSGRRGERAGVVVERERELERRSRPPPSASGRRGGARARAGGARRLEERERAAHEVERELAGLRVRLEEERAPTRRPGAGPPQPVPEPRSSPSGSRAPPPPPLPRPAEEPELEPAAVAGAPAERRLEPPGGEDTESSRRPRRSAVIDR